jgi:hypothetical protein
MGAGSEPFRSSRQACKPSHPPRSINSAKHFAKRKCTKVASARVKINRESGSGKNRHGRRPATGAGPHKRRGPVATAPHLPHEGRVGFHVNPTTPSPFLWYSLSLPAPSCAPSPVRGHTTCTPQRNLRETEPKLPYHQIQGDDPRFNRAGCCQGCVHPSDTPHPSPPVICFYRSRGRLTVATAPPSCLEPGTVPLR